MRTEGIRHKCRIGHEVISEDIQTTKVRYSLSGDFIKTAEDVVCENHSVDAIKQTKDAIAATKRLQKSSPSDALSRYANLTNSLDSLKGEKVEAAKLKTTIAALVKRAEAQQKRMCRKRLKALEDLVDIDRGLMIAAEVLGVRASKRVKRNLISAAITKCRAACSASGSDCVSEVRESLCRAEWHPNGIAKCNSHIDRSLEGY